MTTEASGERVDSARSGRSWVLVAVCLGQFMIQLDLTVVNVALPEMSRSLGASTSVLQWVVDAYNLTVAALLLAGGRAGDRIGHKRVYLAGLVTFGLGSALCAAAPDVSALIGFRVFQGVGAAIEMPATLAILTHAFPDPAERAHAVGVWTGAAGSSLVVGPVLGGGLVEALGWRAVFVVNLPITVIVVVLTVVSVREPAGPSPAGHAGPVGPRGLDVAGQVLGSATLALLTAGAIEGGHRGFADPLPVGLLVAGIAAGTVFVRVERRVADPMLPLGYFARPAYATANGDGLVMGFINIGLVFVLALFF